MSSEGPENTATNPVLSGGLAIVGLLGVAGAVLPPDMLPGNDDVAPVQQVVQPQPAAPAQPAAAEVPAPVFKPAELTDISDDLLRVAEPPADEPVTQPESSTPQSAAEAVSAMMDASAQMLNAAGRVLGGAPEGGARAEASASQPASPGLTQPAPIPAQPVQAAQAPRTRYQPFSPPPMPAGAWQAPAYPQPTYPQSPHTQPVYPRPYMPYPQWGAPQQR